jgi:iojap-related protein
VVAEILPKVPGSPRKKAVVAGPKPRVRKSAEGSPDLLERMQKAIVSSLEDDKAEDVVALDLAGRASFADRMVIATGLADRQIAAMATHLIEKLAELGVKRVQTEGAGGSDWVLVDAGDIVVHLFKAEARAMYALEKCGGRSWTSRKADAAGCGRAGEFRAGAGVVRSVCEAGWA